ncbi:hypothetical protein PR048_005046 [Dryococelus australis]|uniref:Uncharacterized protein n=1 Tax=Dryococelus australis TaxID=614101 RepID=A0ABQ9I753_9NEOP|nr:hypothetical protein PR048_005046 [Dryococelus australis]
MQTKFEVAVKQLRMERCTRLYNVKSSWDQQRGWRKAGANWLQLFYSRDSPVVPVWPKSGSRKMGDQLVWKGRAPLARVVAPGLAFARDGAVLPAHNTKSVRKWESCRTITLVGGFSGGSLISPTLSFWGCSILTSITLIGSQDLAVKGRPNLFTHINYTFLIILVSRRLGTYSSGGRPATAAYSSSQSNQRPVSRTSRSQLENRYTHIKGNATAFRLSRGTTMAQRLDCSPPTMANRVKSPAGNLPDFSWSAVYFGDLPLPPPLHSGAAPFSPHFTLIGFQEPVFKSRPNLSTIGHFARCRYPPSPLTPVRRVPRSQYRAACFEDAALRGRPELRNKRLSLSPSSFFTPPSPSLWAPCRAAPECFTFNTSHLSLVHFPLIRNVVEFPELPHAPSPIHTTNTSPAVASQSPHVAVLFSEVRRHTRLRMDTALRQLATTERLPTDGNSLHLRARPITPTRIRTHARRHSSRQRGIGQPWPAIGAMTTSLSVLIAKLILEETGKNRHRHGKNPVDRIEFKIFMDYSEMVRATVCVCNMLLLVVMKKLVERPTVACIYRALYIRWLLQQRGRGGGGHAAATRQPVGLPGLGGDKGPPPPPRITEPNHAYREFATTVAHFPLNDPEEVQSHPRPYPEGRYFLCHRVYWDSLFTTSFRRSEKPSYEQAHPLERKKGEGRGGPVFSVLLSTELNGDLIAWHFIGRPAEQTSSANPPPSGAITTAGWPGRGGRLRRGASGANTRRDFY